MAEEPAGQALRVRIPDQAKLGILAGDKATDQEGFIAWREKLEAHLDAIWPGLAEVFEKIRDEKVQITESKFTHLVLK